MFLSEWREYPSALCFEGKKNFTTCVSILLKSRASLTCFRACFLPGRATNLSAPLYKRNIKALSPNHCCRWKSISITYSECVFLNLAIKHAIWMLRIMSCAVLLAVPYFSTLSHIRNDILKYCIEHKMYVLIFFTIFVHDISHSMKNNASERYSIINVHRFSYKIPQILMKLEYSDKFSESSQI